VSRHHRIEMGLNLEKELAFYRKYHCMCLNDPLHCVQLLTAGDQVNVSIHVACVPLILMTTFMMATRAKVPVSILEMALPHVPSEYYKYISLGTASAVGYGVFYALLDVAFGLPLLPVLVYATLKMSDIADDNPAAIRWALGIFVVAWVLQFIGHGVFEKRAPALLDNLVQALVLAPFFVVFEVAYAFGIRTSVIDKVDAIIKPEIEAFRAAKATGKNQ
jgi:uncharacterized membrane protein YGL010W